MGFTSNGATIGSSGLNGNGFNSGLSSANSSRIWPDLGVFGDIVGYVNDGFSIIAGWVDGYRTTHKLSKIKGLNKASNILMGIGIAIDVGLCVYDNLTAPGLTAEQRAGNIVGDILYIAVSQTITWGVTALLAMIPYVGWIIAPIVGFAVSQGLDYLWNGGGFLGAFGVEPWKPGGKTIQQHVGDFFVWLLEGG